jgi:thiamine monophosphate synthase
MTRDDADQAMKQHGSQSKAATALGVSRSALRRALAHGQEKGPAAKSKARSLSEFRQQYDLETIVPQRVQAAFREMGAGWLYEVEFAKLANVTTAQLSAFRDRYADHIVAVRDSRRIWAGRVDIARQMREML